jgi:hypothetical protein
MLDTAMVAIEALRVDPFNWRALRQIGLWGFNEQMIMVGHETVGLALPFYPLAGFTQDIKEGFPVSILRARPLPREFT